ncbi:Asp23/Gls24 family protein [Streptomyces sp. ICBB 8177]|uniref:Asp23/Gls24 family protein n=1 Tax=Streptomyces sp. ICBB 8177 TaxID=563922 RepID=UPI000D6806E8|nr:Asp23/Gls24 family protein [Streptomyces sp. ICBB 8177]PWI43566.1 hypothetical protein CK485_15685 [Streptomyces sp. ICBB 8177]
MTAGLPLGRLPAAERGATRVADRVVAKIAAQAAREALAGAPRADLVPPGRRPQAMVTVVPAELRARGRGLARVRLAVELGYPADIRGVCAEVRGRVADRVGELVDMDVPEVSVEVDRLHSAATTRRERGRVR